MIKRTRTKFPTTVKPVTSVKTVLGFGENNVKLGGTIKKGEFTGYKVRTLSLEERATCPNTCTHWDDCYGNNMPFAKRIDHADPEFLPTLSKELDDTVAKAKVGVIVRLHVLGDFYSAKYVDFWGDKLAEHDKLAVWGYTARKPTDPVGRAVVQLRQKYGKRFSVRESDGAADEWTTRSIATEADKPPEAFICPEQTGGTDSCSTCGACWGTKKPVAFVKH